MIAATRSSLRIGVMSAFPVSAIIHPSLNRKMGENECTSVVSPDMYAFEFSVKCASRAARAREKVQGSLVFLLPQYVYQSPII